MVPGLTSPLDLMLFGPVDIVKATRPFSNPPSDISIGVPMRRDAPVRFGEITCGSRYYSEDAAASRGSTGGSE